MTYLPYSSKPTTEFSTAKIKMEDWLVMDFKNNVYVETAVIALLGVKKHKIVSKWHVCSNCFLFPLYFTPENMN